MNLNKLPILSKWFSASIDGKQNKGYTKAASFTKAVTIEDLKKRRMFIGIGAMKAGTSWLSDYLKDHPEVFHSPIKELNYFNKLIDNPLNHDDVKFRLRRMEMILLDDHQNKPYPPARAQYQRLKDIAAMGRIGTIEENYFEYFANRIGDETIFGEMSPSYTHLGIEGYQKMVDCHPDVRIIFLMRDPVERTCSHIRHIWRNKPELELEDIIDNMTPTSPFYFRSDYGPTLDAVHAAFDKDRVFVDYYETLFTEDAIARLCEFLGVSFHQPDFAHQPNMARTKNISDEDKKRIREKLDPVYKDMIKRMGKEELPNRWKI